jgi:hypothetical protein
MLELCCCGLHLQHRLLPLMMPGCGKARITNLGCRHASVSHHSVFSFFFFTSGAIEALWFERAFGSWFG